MWLKYTRIKKKNNFFKIKILILKVDITGNKIFKISKQIKN